MDKFLDAFQKLMPLLAFYPRLVQLLFLITFLMFLASVAVFVVLYPSASEKKQRSDTSKQLPVEIRQQIDRDLASMATLTADLGSAISNYYAASVALRLHLLDYTSANPNYSLYLQQTLPDHLKRDVEVLIQRLGSLEASLAAIHRNSFAAACWERAAANSSNSALEEIQVKLIQRGFSQTEATIDLGNLPNAAQFFSAAANALRDFTFEPILLAVMHTNLAQTPAIGMAYDHAALRTLVFSGNLIFAFSNSSRTQPPRRFVASWGTAILRDLYWNIPDTVVVRAELLERHSAHLDAIQSLALSFPKSPPVSQDFRTAVDELDKRRALLFLDVP